MIRKTFIFILLITVSSVVFGQSSSLPYLPYTANTPAPPPPIQLPASPQFPMPLYPLYSPPSSDSKPAISIVSTYRIKVAKINGKDFSQHYINANAGIIIFRIPDKPMNFMAIAMPGENSYSYGAMLAVSNEETPQTSTSYGKTTTLFSWDYQDSYDDKKGTATVTLTKEYRPEGTICYCHVVTIDHILDFTAIIHQ